MFYTIEPNGVYILETTLKDFNLNIGSLNNSSKKTYALITKLVKLERACTFFQEYYDDPEIVKLIILDSPSFRETEEGTDFVNSIFYKFFDALFNTIIPDIIHFPSANGYNFNLSLGWINESTFKEFKSEISKFNIIYKNKVEILDSGSNYKYNLLDTYFDYSLATYFLIQKYKIIQVTSAYMAHLNNISNLKLEIDIAFKVYSPLWGKKISPINSPVHCFLDGNDNYETYPSLYSTNMTLPTASASLKSSLTTSSSTASSSSTTQQNPKLSQLTTNNVNNFTFGDALPLLKKAFYNKKFYCLPRILIKNRSKRTI